MKKFLLPVLAVLCAAAAVIVLAVVPRGGAAGRQSGSYAESAGDGSVIIRAADLSTDTVSFYRLAEDSAVELIAVRDEDGTAWAALGTCQSCNGSPNAYYTQTGSLLQCGNCGLTFPLSVIGADGAGCHPIMMDQSAVEHRGDDLALSVDALRAYEPLFAGIAAH